MKIITKKSVIFAALAVVLLATVLVISCNAPLDGISEKEEPSKPGTGKVKLTINNRNASRTILPALPASGNRRYLLILTGNGGALGDFVDNVVSGTTLSGVPIGTYTAAQVIMYDSATAFDPETDDLNDLISDLAIGESVKDVASINVTGVGGAKDLGTHTIVLYTPGSSTDNNAGSGTFAYKITAVTTNGGAADRLETTVANGTSFHIQGIGATYSGAGSSPTPILFNQAQDTTVSSSIPSGYYYVIYTLTDKDPTPNTIYFYDIIHVYKNMKSVFTRTFTNDFFPDSVSPPSYGSIEVTITGPQVPVDVRGDMSATTSRVNLGTTTNGICKVTIDKGSTTDGLMFKVTSPDTGISAVWQSVSGSGISNVANGGGITVNIDNPNQEWTISFDQTTWTPATDGPFIYQLQLMYGGAPFSTPSYHIYLK